MNRDLENQLNEMGPAYRAVVARLRAGGEADSAGLIGGRRGPTFIWLTWNPRRLVAASLVALLGLAVFFQAVRTPQNAATSDIRAPREYRASVAEMIATQNPDGSWTNDFLTRRNAAKLKASGDPAARIAYKKAARYLTAKGLAPLT